jgi:hypothetical protein
VECVFTGKPSSVSGRDGLYALQLAHTVADQASHLLALSSMPSQGIA